MVGKTVPQTKGQAMNISRMVVACLMGVVLGSAGVTVFTWQFYAAVILMVAYHELAHKSAEDD